MALPTREIEEIVELHIREGNRVQEVFVEGNQDKHFYENFLVDRGYGHVAVLAISTVNVPDKSIVDIGLAIGNKGRVVALAASLEGRVKQNQVVCIADSDLDHFKELSYGYSLLLLTDYTSIELYALCPSVMKRILQVGLNAFPKSYTQVVGELGDLLQGAFLVRVASDDLKLSPTYPEHSGFCKFDKKHNIFKFSLLEYINKAFEAYTDTTWRDPLNKKIEERRKQLKADVRVQMHGHDFVCTLSWYIRQHAGYGHLNPATLAELMLGFVDSNTLSKEPLFVELLKRLAR